MKGTDERKYKDGDKDMGRIGKESQTDNKGGTKESRKSWGEQEPVNKLTGKQGSLGCFAVGGS